MPTSGSYRIEALSQENFSAFLRLRAIVDGKPVDEKRIAAKFSTERFGHAPIGFLALAPDDTPAAYYGVFPLRLRLNDQIIDGAQSGDTMTHPEHRRKGLFVQLAELTYAACREKNIRLVYGLPNPEAQPGFAKLGWRTCGVWQRAQLAASPGFGIRLQRKFIVAAFQKKMQRVLDQYRIGADTIQQKNLPGHCVVQRDADWFSYKLGMGSHLIGLKHGKALVQVSNWGWTLGEAFDVSDHQKFWIEITALAAGTGAHAVNFQFSPGLETYYQIPTLAQRGTGLPVIVLDLGAGINDQPILISAADADTF